MNEEKYAELVARLEDFAKQAPARYRLLVGLLAALGYLYLLGALALIVGAIAAIGYLMVIGKDVVLGFKVEIGLLILAWIVVRSMAVRITPPKGLPLTRQNAPALFDLLDGICRRLRAPAFHHVLLDDNFNAGVIQVPRLGLIGWQVNYLVLGLPLMKALSPAQFEAVVAHEVGHLSGNHSRFGGWIYRLRQTWNVLVQDLHKRRHKGAILFRKFFDWYAPYFAAYSFVLARRNEYEADRCSAEIAGRQAAGATLIAIAVNRSYLSTKYWPSVMKQANENPEPACSPFAMMFTSRELLRDDTTRWFDSALSEKTGLGDTHPCLADRLAALGLSPSAGDLAAALSDAPVENAASRYLGQSALSLAASLDNAWKAQIAPRWKQRYQHACQVRQSLLEIQTKAHSGQALTLDEAWNRARWTAEMQSNEAALPLYQDVLAMAPDHILANLNLGVALLDRNDPSGVGLIEKAMSQDSDRIIAGCQAIYRYLVRSGKQEQAEPYRKRAKERMEIVQLAQAERAGFTSRDNAWPHDLSAEQVAKIVAVLAGVKNVEAAYLARKAVAYLPEKPYYVLFITPRYGFLEQSRQQANVRLLAAVKAQLRMPGKAWLIVNQKGDPRLKKILRDAPQARIYGRR